MKRLHFGKKEVPLELLGTKFISIIVLTTPKSNFEIIFINNIAAVSSQKGANEVPLLGPIGVNIMVDVQ